MFAPARAHRRHSDDGLERRATRLRCSRTIARPNNQVPAIRVATPPASRRAAATFAPGDGACAAWRWIVRPYRCMAPFARARTAIRKAIDACARTFARVNAMTAAGVRTDTTIMG